MSKASELSTPAQTPADGAGEHVVEVDEISFESALDMLGGSHAGNVPGCG